MCTVLNAAQVIIVHTASGTKTWQLHISDQEKTNIDSTHLGRLAAALGVSGLNTRVSFNAYKVLQKIRKVFCNYAGEGVLMKFTLEIVYQQEAERLGIDADKVQGNVADAHNAGVDAEMTYIYAKGMIELLYEYLVKGTTPAMTIAAYAIDPLGVVLASDS